MTAWRIGRRLTFNNEDVNSLALEFPPGVLRLKKTHYFTFESLSFLALYNNRKGTQIKLWSGQPVSFVPYFVLWLTGSQLLHKSRNVLKYILAL